MVQTWLNIHQWDDFQGTWLLAVSLRILAEYWSHKLSLACQDPTRVFAAPTTHFLRVDLGFWGNSDPTSHFLQRSKIKDSDAEPREPYTVSAVVH